MVSKPSKVTVKINGKQTRFFLTESKTYASVDSYLSKKIKQAYGIERGTIAGLRPNPKKPWRIYAYWSYSGGLRRKCLGSINDVLERLESIIFGRDDSSH